MLFVLEYIGLEIYLIFIFLILYPSKSFIFFPSCPMTMIISEQNFMEEGIWDSKMIKKDYLERNNIHLIWYVVKHYLMLSGFKNRLANVNKNHSKDFLGPNNLTSNLN